MSEQKAAEKPKPNRKLYEHALKLAEDARTRWTAVPEAGTAFRELLDPVYWANVYTKLNFRPQPSPIPDVIEVTSADGTWWAEMLVRHSGAHSAKVEFLIGRVFGMGTFTDADEFAKATDLRNMLAAGPAAAGQKAQVQEGYEVKNRGKNGWQVIRKSDNTPLKDGFETQAAAVAWLEQHTKTFA